MTWVASPELTSLASRIIARRHELLAHELSETRNSVATDFARRGVAGPAVVAKIAAVWGEAFLKYGADVTEQPLELIRKSESELNSDVSTWARAEIHKNLTGSATGIAASLKELATGRGVHAVGSGTAEALVSRLTRDIDRALIAARRDVDIALDKAVLENRHKPHVEPSSDAALIDVLPPVKNRRAFEQDLAALLQTAKDSKEPFAVMVFDIDHFKQVNDDHGGHATGDEALRDISARAESVVRGKGSAYRYGGDEFALLLPNHAVQEAIALAERLRLAVNSTPVTGEALTVSISIGLAIFPEHGAEADALKKAADDAAYDAKNLGRNLVRVYGEVPPEASGPREAERRRPIPGALTEEQKDEIRLHFLRHGWAACPHDEARLQVTDTTTFGDVTKRLYVSCPFCGLAEHLG